MAPVFGPTWFYGIDYIIDLVSVIVCLLVSYLSYKVYRYISQKNYLHFALSFFLVSVAFISKMLATLPVYSNALQMHNVGLITITTEVVHKISWVNQFGVSIARFLMLLAFLLLVVVSLKIHDRKIISLLIYFLVIATSFASNSYEIFHFTMFFMILILFLNFRENHLSKKSPTSKLVMISFFIILISQIFFIFEGMIPYTYVVGEIIQVIGYLVLLYAIIRMLKK